MMRSPEAYIEVGLFAERQPMSGLTKQLEGLMKIIWIPRRKRMVGQELMDSLISVWKRPAVERIRL